MAIKDPNVLNRIKALNTNLEKAEDPDIAKVEENISKRLFNVLEWSNNISVDSELYASVDKLASALDIANYIDTAKTNLSSTHVSIPYTWWAFNVPNSVITLAAGAPIADTETAITNMNNAIAELNTLPDQINTLRSRLQQNLTTLNEIHNIQFTGIPDTLTNIDSNRRLLGNYKRKCRNLITTLRTIERLENLSYYNDWTTRWTNAFNDRNNAVTNFNTAYWRAPAFMWNLPDWTSFNVSHFDRNADSWLWKLSEFEDLDGRIEALDNTYEQAHWKRQNLDRLINQLPKQPGERILVPNNLWLFNSDDTIVTSALATLWETDTERRNITDRLNKLDVLQWQIETLRVRYQENLDKLKKILALQQLQERMNATHPREMERRQREFNTIREISKNNLLLWPWAPATYEPYLPNTAIGVWETWVWWNPAREIHLDFVYWALWIWFNGWARNLTYSLCDGAWNPLTSNGLNLEIQQWWQTISLWWITFDNTAQTMTINNLQVTPIEWLTFPLILDLNVRVRIHDNDTGLDIDHHKPIHLEITRPTLDHTARENAYDRLNPPMNERVAAEYSDKYRENLENEAIWSILREWKDEKEVDEIYNNETRRNIFINRIRRRLWTHIPLLELWALQTGFRTDMTREDRDVPVEYLLGENQFQNYIRQSIPDNLKVYASKAIHDNANIQRDDIFQEFLNFQSDIVNNLVDKADTLNVLASIPTERPEWHPKTFLQRLTWHESVQNNYTKFFQWRHAELNDLSLETEDWIIKYWVKIEVTWINKLTATINIDWQDEPEIIDAPNHDELITWILNMANTKDGEPVNKKLLCNIALSVLKAMVLMAPQKLSRQIPNTNFNWVSCDRIEASVKWWNLRIRWWWVDWSRTRHNVTIFDEAQFKELHDENMLENWIRELSTQINRIMNATAQEYHEATSAMLKNDWNRYLMRYNTAERFRWWPIKRLWWRMIHGKTSNDFDFDNITVNEAWKTVNIKLEKWLFTVSGNHEWESFEYKSRNLWSILRKQKGRDYVFNGVELAMIAAINEAFIQKLRKNHWVETENFVISDVNDGKTGRTYIFDSSWNLSYLEIEDANLNPLGAGQTWRIDPNQIPTARRRCNDEERRDFMQNPLLAWRLQRAMRRRLALF